MGRGVERAQHSGEITERRLLEAPHPQGPRGVSLEVDDDEVLARVEHLAEMIVSVTPLPHHLDLALPQQAQPAPEKRFLLEQRAGLGLDLGRQRRQSLAQRAHGLVEQPEDGLVERVPGKVVEGFGGEFRAPFALGQGQV